MRRKINIKRTLAPDFKYQSEKVTKLMNYIMFDGKKNQDETDADCGGNTCAARCANLKTCTVDADCTSQLCANGVCHGVSFAAPSPITLASSTPVSATACSASSARRHSQRPKGVASMRVFR